MNKASENVPGKILTVEKPELAWVFCCGHCHQPVVTGCVYVWTKDEVGEAQHATLLHRKCETGFKLEHAKQGPWFRTHADAPGMQTQDGRADLAKWHNILVMFYE